jgi:predicted anti-sigma-YlaC factor YlaD
VKCDDCIRALAEYADGALSGSLCREIERHLGECDPCGELRRDLEDLSRLCREADASSPVCLPGELRVRLRILLSKT